MNSPVIPVRRRPWSMTARLVSLQVLTVAVLLGGVLVLLYHMLATHLEEDNREFVVNQATVLSRWLADIETREPLAPGGSPRTELLATLPVLVRLTGSDGRILIESHDPELPPATAFPRDSSALSWRSSQGHRYLLDSFSLPGAAGAANRQLQLAYSAEDDDLLLRHLRQRMGMAYVATLIMSGIVALLIARGVFRPLRLMTATAAHVQASQLNARLEGSGWPAELTALAREFDAMLARLDDSFRRLGRFSSDLSHELRTPINNLRGEAEVALSRPRTAEEYRRVLESGLEECARLGRLIDTLLFIAKSDHPAHGLKRLRLDAAAECRAVADFFEPMATERKLSILVRGSASVYCDPELLRRALANLLDNAVRHTPAQGHIDLIAREDGQGGTEIEISDSGTGIPPEDLPRVFERFYRSEKNSGERQTASGFGLGLAIVKSIMDLHAGSVQVVSPPGVGTTVTLRFPHAAS